MRFPRILALANRFGAVWIAVISLYVVSGLVSPGMFHVNQVLNILQVAAFLGVVATGQTLALLVGGIDVSVAGVVTMSNIVSTSVMIGRSETMLSGIVICLLIAAVVGLINGGMITMLRVTPLVATLAMNSILFGGALVYTGRAAWNSLAGIHFLRPGPPGWAAGEHTMLAGNCPLYALVNSEDGIRTPALCRWCQPGSSPACGHRRKTNSNHCVHSQQRHGGAWWVAVDLLYRFTQSWNRRPVPSHFDRSGGCGRDRPQRGGRQRPRHRRRHSLHHRTQQFHQHCKRLDGHSIRAPRRHYHAERSLVSPDWCQEGNQLDLHTERIENHGKRQRSFHLYT